MMLGQPSRTAQLHSVRVNVVHLPCAAHAAAPALLLLLFLILLMILLLRSCLSDAAARNSSRIGAAPDQGAGGFLTAAEAAVPAFAIVVECYL